MAKKQTLWKTKGMNRDLSVSAFNPEFSFENKNLRLSTNEGNTLLSWVTEKGTEEITNITVTGYNQGLPIGLGSVLQGIAIGTAVINNTLVLFTTKGGASKDKDTIYSIVYYRISVSPYHSLRCTRLFQGYLNFSVEHPLETLVSYEAEDIQKVYWVDGINPPRVINICATPDKIEKWKHTPDGSVFFDFVPPVNLEESLEVVNNGASGGTFAPGTIQYCFTYINKYGQQSNVIRASSLYYLSYNDRGASPEDKVTNTFTITIEDPDENFDYIRLYSIQKTSLDGPAFVRILEDLPMISLQTGTKVVNGVTVDYKYITYTDNGIHGSTLDPNELLYVGGKEIAAGTLADKDNTLFLGNIEEKNRSVKKIQDYFRENKPDKTFSANKTLTLDAVTGIYGNTHQLIKGNQQDITTFKGGENYRFGFQLQKVTGEWTEPIWIGDAENTIYPNIVSATSIGLVTMSANIDLEIFTLPEVDDLPNPYYIEGFEDIYKRVRPVVVYPSIGDRQVLCQGVLNPTVFNAQDRKTSSPYAQASWYFRPYMVEPATEGAAPSLPDIDVGYNPSGTYTAQVELDQKHTYNPPSDKIDPVWYNGSYIRSYLEDVFVLVAEMSGTASEISEIVSSGSLTYVVGATTSTVPFKGAIQLYSNNPEAGFSSTEYAFISDIPWPDGGSYTGVSSYKTSFSFKMYNGIRGNQNNLLYYIEPQTTDAQEYPLDTYEFHFYVGKYSDDPNENQAVFYNVAFSSAMDDGSIYEPPSFEPNTYSYGRPLPYTHFESLVTDDKENTVDDCRRVEIQGSVKSYNDVKSEDAGVKSNTQFFIDQSIVTLNSPDLEFDTETQVFGVENLKLRVVGYIPITANVSAHSITTSSNMLEEAHNLKNNSGYVGKFGRGELDINVIYTNGYNDYAGNRLVSEYMWNDVLIKQYGDGTPNVNKDAAEEEGITTGGSLNFLVYPWHRKGSLNNDFRSADKASSLLKTKKESNLLFSDCTKYLSTVFNRKSFINIGVQIPLTENAEVMNYRLPKQFTNSSPINYYPNIDKVLYNGDGYLARTSNGKTDMPTLTSPVSMKYKSTTHAVISLEGNEIPVLPYYYHTNSGITTYYGKYSDSGTQITPFWNGSAVTYSQVGIGNNNIDSNDNVTINNNFLWLGELYKAPVNPFGGTSDEALKANRWLVGGDDKLNDTSIPIQLIWNIGDTYYQRYDCLKTYAFTDEDSNQLVEILSFMCETRVNIDGRYDRNRGQVDNTRMNPFKNFNLWNDAYSQKNNYFTYRIINTDKSDDFNYPNQVFYTKTKTSGADIDLWTNITLASTLELDGDKGQVNKLVRFNDQILAFQDTGFSQILYNENMQISTTEGVPIEIANSGKVNGKRYISNTIGCSNKWSLVNTPSGIYFIDNHDKNIYVFDGQLHNLSVEKGFNSWCKQNIPNAGTPWTPWYEDGYTIKGFDDFVTYYDKMNKDILFINKDTALAYSEKIGTFTSFYDYGGIPYFVMLDGKGIWLTSGKIDDPDDSTPPISKIWSTVPHLHQTGSYCQFFGTNRPYWMTLVGNPEPQIDKIFTNIEFRACVDGDGTESTLFNPYLPFDHLESWDEYQHGIANLATRRGHNAFVHHTTDMNASLKRRFRMWRCDIPRDNVAVPVLPAEPTPEERAAYDAFMASEAEKGIYRFRSHPLDRMRNPWVYLKLTKDAAGVSSTLPRAEIHDLMMTYFS